SPPNLARGVSLYPFEDSSGSHAAADTHRDHSVSRSAPLHLVQQSGGQFGSSAAQGVSEGYRSAIHINFGGIEAQLSNDRERLDGKCLIEFNDIDVFQL